jgi:GntR family transcriptional regulator/MocR family aminotransferase
MTGGRPVPNLLIRVDGRSRDTLQQQLYRGIRRAILSGLAAPGTRLPSSRALADDLRVSRTTAVLAVEQLVAEGYLAPRRGSGTFVADDLPDDLAAFHRESPPARGGGPRGTARPVVETGTRRHGDA